METEVKEKEKAKRGKELKEFCPPNRRPLPLLLSLSFYAWRQGNKQTIFSPETCSHCRDSCHECPALPIRQIIMRKFFFKDKEIRVESIIKQKIKNNKYDN